jgi:hypothetical protein
MSKVRMGIVVEPKPTTYGLGSSDTKTMKTVYPASPLYNGGYNKDEEVEKIFEDITGMATGNIDDHGYAFGIVNRNYQDAPNLEEVKTGGGGLPGTPYSPNPAAAPAGTDPFNATNIPEVPPDTINKPGGGFGVGNGLASPSATSAYIGRKNRKIGDAIPLGDGSDSTMAQVKRSQT